MTHSVANLERHHFKYRTFLRPGDLHVHFFGTDTLSFSENISAREGDVFEVQSPWFGRALRNTLQTVSSRSAIESEVVAL